tara:strand:- start:12236 stop:12583 length:348 start_codon:yes stop_codon:yes gene_type:complete
MARGDLEITGYIDDDDGVPTRPTVSEDQIKIIEFDGPSDEPITYVATPTAMGPIKIVEFDKEETPSPAPSAAKRDFRKSAAKAVEEMKIFEFGDKDDGRPKAAKKESGMKIKIFD